MTMNAPLTLFANEPVETGKTDKTDMLSNNEFLQAVFGSLSDEVCPVLVSFVGHPGKVTSSSWRGFPWHGEAHPPADHNNYFSLATFRPDEAGRYRRQKARFQALHAVMLDDVGTKVAEERLTLQPTWMLETSPGNCQAGYLFKEPLTDGGVTDRLMDAIVAANLCDPGANGPRARLARLPVAVNGKHTPPYACRLLHWEPELRYTVEELVDGLQLEMLSAQRGQRRKQAQSEQPVDGDPVWIPCPDENVVLSALRNHGLYKKPLGGGKHDITCPWVSEHTDQADDGTAYFEPDDSWPIGGFKCHHGHCAQRHIRDLLQHLEIGAQEARMKPVIRVAAGEVNRVVDAAEQELARSGHLYQRGGFIVMVVTDPGSRETRVQELRQPALLRKLDTIAIWEAFSKKENGWVKTNPPALHTSVLFDSPGYPHLPVLNGLTRQPYLRPDGSLMMTAGYDKGTGMYGVFDARHFTVPEAPTIEQARQALKLLQGLLDEFCFARAVDLAAALAALLTAAIRPSLIHAPMFHVRAHMVGSGKSYLCELITALATPQRGTPTTFPADDEECRKLLLAELLRAPAVIEFDNLTSDLIAHKSLCTVLTSEFMTGRVLGVSRTATVNTRTLFLSSGNNVGPVQDMARRCITILLDPGCEIPAARTFTRPDLVREVLRERGRYVSAALTIIRAWIVAGRPKSVCKALSGFGEWSDVCRQPLMWLGCDDPTVSVFEAMSEDPDRETLGRLLVAWQTVFGKMPAMIRDAVREAQFPGDEYVELREAIHDIAAERGEVNRRKLGWWLRRRAGRIVDGRRFIRGSGNRSAETWQVEEVEKSVSPVSSVF
jgi:hypothetical protein